MCIRDRVRGRIKKSWVPSRAAHASTALAGQGGARTHRPGRPGPCLRARRSRTALNCTYARAAFYRRFGDEASRP
eukprot:11214559-Lingulodinium_polyedra.AAC.1